MGATFKGNFLSLFFFTKEENKEGKNGGEGKKIRWMGKHEKKEGGRREEGKEGRERRNGKKNSSDLDSYSG